MERNVWDSYGWDLKDFDQEFVYVEFGMVKRSTPLSLLLVIEGQEVWVPRGQIESLDRNKESPFDTSGIMSIPSWLADAKGI